jgi:hypothetical protein
MYVFPGERNEVCGTKEEVEMFEANEGADGESKLITDGQQQQQSRASFS